MKEQEMLQKDKRDRKYTDLLALEKERRRGLFSKKKVEQNEEKLLS